jgi:glycosyltransferase involved in cell wall biosynthesis
MPFILQSKSIVTIHDLSFKKHPNFFNFKNRLIFFAFGKLSAEKADSIITISNSSKRDIIDFYHIDVNKIWVTYLAANEDFSNLDKNRFSIIRKKYKIDSKYVLSIGSFEPKKNLLTLLKAFKKIISENAIEHHLVIVHKDKVGINKAFRQLKLLGILERIKMIPYVDTQDLPYLYALADVFVYPSIYEGFGLPVLEAMSSGVPVVCSNTSSLPEVVNDSALTFDPYDIKGLSKAILAIIKDPILRQRMIQKGTIRASQFSWDRTAAQTLMIYSSVCGAKL